LARFEKTVSDQWIDGPRDGHPFDENRPPHQLKRFVTERARSVRKQLDGKDSNVVLTRNPF
ncbi:MAG: hypothetical protein HY043_04480, partial [Verrucomicrobia bacterium]|nr:hypothetical protein [Verrucomicrobiota bacterium]